jgi:hypothetical protein
MIRVNARQMAASFAEQWGSPSGGQSCQNLNWPQLCRAGHARA